jgi:methylmalonyl-CoA epimerase
LEKRGEGIHHICLEVSDLTGHLTVLQKEGVKVLSEKSEIGAEGYPVAFVHPKSTSGVLLELLEKKTRLLSDDASKNR